VARDNFYAVNVSQDKWDSIFGKTKKKMDPCPGCPYSDESMPCVLNNALSYKEQLLCPHFSKLFQEGKV
jgi:hypothetical protein